MKTSLVRGTVMGVALALAASAGQAQVFSTTPVLPIPATGTLGTVQATLDVSGGPASITDVNVIFDITHTFTGDLDIILVPPSGGVYVHLTSDSGGAGDNFNFTRFDQQSSVSIAAGAPLAVAPFNGNFRPEGGDVIWRAAANIPLPGPSLADLSSLNGLDSNGTWTLIIEDDAGGDIGTLNYWSLEFNGALDSQGPPPGSPPFVQVPLIANPTPIVEGQSVVFSIQVNPGTQPASTGLTVTGDTTLWSSAGTVNFNDSGTGGDAVAGDGIWSVTVPVGAFPGARTFPITVSDAEGRSTSVTPGFTIVATPSGACCVGTECTVVRQIQCAEISGTFTAGADCGTVSYAVSTSTSAFESIAAVGSLTSNSGCDDCMQSGTPIGFDFNFNGNTYNTVNISSNGNLQFPASNVTTFTNVRIPATGTPNNMIAAMWDDLNPGAAGDIFTFLDETGGPGNRKFIVSWENVTQFALTTVENFQVVLFEGSNNFEIRYGTITAETPAGDYTIGYENETGTAGFEIPGVEIGSGNTARLFTFSQGAGPCSAGPTCFTCAADHDNDGGITPADVSSFFSAFEAGTECGDVDQDGGITPADVSAFFSLFEAGGC
jgi:subtilisin-like proprotein convertase family protein